MLLLARYKHYNGSNRFYFQLTHETFSASIEELNKSSQCLARNTSRFCYRWSWKQQFYSLKISTKH